MVATPGNSVNITSAGLVKFDGTNAFSAVTTTNHSFIIGAASNGITNLASGSTGQILQTNTGADPTWSTATYPSTAGTSGNVLTSDGTNWTSSAPAGATSTANSTISFVDDIIATMTPTNITNSTATVGNWGIAASGVGTQIFPGTSVEVNHPGTFWMNTGTTASNFCVASLGSGNSAPFLLGGGVLTATLYFKLPTLSVAGARYLITVGLGDGSSTGGTGCYVQYTDNVNSGKWTYTCANSGVTTTTNSATTVNSGWQVVQIVVNAAATSVSFSQGSTLAGLASLGAAITTNIPTLDIAPYFRINYTTGTTSVLIADMVTISQPLTTAR